MNTPEEAQKIADALHFACRDPNRRPDFTACGGPAAEAYWDYFTPARITALLGALEAATGALERHMHWCTDSRGRKLCGGCLSPWPCPDRGLLRDGTDE